MKIKRFDENYYSYYHIIAYKTTIENKQYVTNFPYDSNPPDLSYNIAHAMTFTKDEANKIKNTLSQFGYKSIIIPQ